MPDPLNAAGNEQKMPKGKLTYGYTKTSKPVKKSNMGYTKKMTKIKRTNPKGASVNDFDDTVVKYTPYKMKAGKEGPMRKNFPSAFKKEDKDKDKTVVSKTVQDSTVEQGYQPSKKMGVMTFASVERLKKFNAPKEVVQKEYDKQMGIAKQKAGL